MSSLYVIATPIGNRKDITLRAIETMFSVDVLLCEDTRKTKQLLDFYRNQLQNIPVNDWFNPHSHEIPRLLSYFEHNEDRRIPEVIEFLKQGLTVGLVTNAGTPTISDPGFVLIEACRKADFPVVSIPGPSALAGALSVSGLAPDKVLFLGFLPRKLGKQTKIWQGVLQSGLSQTVLFYESPYRITKTLANIQQTLGDVNVTIARELTKVHEEVKTQPLSVWLTELKKGAKGEIVVLLRVNVDEL